MTKSTRRIVFIAPLWGDVLLGGVENFVAEQVLAFTRSDYHVEILTNGAEESITENGRISVFRRKCSGYNNIIAKGGLRDRLHYHVAQLFSGQTFAQLVNQRLAIDPPPVGVISHSVASFGWTWLRALRRDTSVKWVHYVHGYQALCIRQTMATRSCKTCSRQCIRCSLWQKILKPGLLFSHARVVYNSEFVASMHRRAGLRAMHESVRIPAWRASSPRAVFPADDSPITLGFAGQLIDSKGLRELVDAVRSTGVYLLVAGNGPLMGYGEGARVRYLGRLSRRQLVEFYATIHGLVVPSRYPEPFGLVALEALSAGVPVIATRVGGLQEVVRDGCGGIPVDSGEPLAKNIAIGIEQFGNRISKLRAEAELEGARLRHKLDPQMALHELIQWLR